MKLWSNVRECVEQMHWISSSVMAKQLSFSAGIKYAARLLYLWKDATFASVALVLLLSLGGSIYGSCIATYQWEPVIYKVIHSFHWHKYLPWGSCSATTDYPPFYSWFITLPSMPSLHPWNCWTCPSASLPCQGLAPDLTRGQLFMWGVSYPDIPLLFFHHWCSMLHFHPTMVVLTPNTNTTIKILTYHMGFSGH